MTVKNHFFRRLASDKRILVCAGLLFSMTMTSGFISNRPVSIAVDGHTIELNTPYRTPANILSQAGVTIQDEDECLLTSDDDGNTVLTVNRAVPVVFNIDGKKEEAKTCKPTVGEAVESFGYVGNGYQRQMMKILDEYCKSINKKYIFTKVCSDNVYSLNNMLKDNYVVTDEYENERGKMSAFLKIL